MTLATTMEVQLGLGLALLLGLSIGWITRGWALEYQRRNIERQIEKSGVWRCEDRGYYLVRQSKFGGQDAEIKSITAR